MKKIIEVFISNFSLIMEEELQVSATNKIFPLKTEKLEQKNLSHVSELKT